MRLLFFLFICLTGTSTNLFGQSGTAAKVLDTEVQRFAAMTRKDTTVLKNYLADDLLYTHSNALTETKAMHLAAIGSGATIYKTITRDPDPVVRVYGKVALTNGSVQVAGVLKGNPFELHLKYSAVYRKQKGKWLLVNWQSTRM